MRRRRAIATCAATLLCFFALGGVGERAYAGPPDYLRVEFVADAHHSPYREIRYVLRVVRGHATLHVRKVLLGDFPSQNGVALLSKERYDKLWAALTACELTSLKSRKSRKGAMRWKVAWSQGESNGEFAVADPHLLSDLRYLACLDAVRDEANASVGTMPFMSPYIPVERLGFLQSTSTPAARVFIDGQDTGQTTPVAGIPLESGMHTVVYEISPGVRRDYTFRIMPGMTTNLDVDLK